MLRASGYERWVATDHSEPSDHAITGWRHQGDDATKPNLALELWNVSEQLAVMCVAHEHLAAFLFDKAAAIISGQVRQIPASLPASSSAAT